MRRLFLMKNLIALVLVLCILGFVIYMISLGWVNLATHLSHALVLGGLGFCFHWNIIYRQEHDPVRRFCFRIWDAFWNRFC